MSAKTMWMLIAAALALPLVSLLAYVNMGSGTGSTAESHVFPKKADPDPGLPVLNEPPKSSMMIPVRSTTPAPAAETPKPAAPVASANPAPAPPPAPAPAPAPPPAPAPAAPQPAFQAQAEPPGPRPKLAPSGKAKSNFMNFTFQTRPKNGGGFGSNANSRFSAGVGMGQTRPNALGAAAAGSPGGAPVQPPNARAPAAGGAPANVAIPNDLLQKALQSAGASSQQKEQIQQQVSNIAGQNQMTAPKPPADVQKPAGSSDDLQMNSIQDTRSKGGAPLNGGGPINSGQ